MNKYRINLVTMTDINNFVKIASSLRPQVHLIDGAGFRVNGKSLLGAMAMGFVAAKVLDANVAMWIGLALIAAITGVFGDLVESMLKRSVDVKDSGSFIPGHGGWLDRFDALIFSVPFAFIYLIIVEFI